MPAVAVNWPNMAQINTWYKAYCDTHSKANKSFFERATLLQDIEGGLGDSFEDFLRDPEKGFGLTPVEAQRCIDLVEAIKRYPGGNHKSSMLWEAMGDQIIRLVKIPDPIIRKSVRDRCYRHAEEMNGFISSPMLTNFIKLADPNYFEEHPTRRKLAKDRLVRDNIKLQKKVNSLANGLRHAVEFLIEAGYTPEEAGISIASRKIADI